MIEKVTITKQKQGTSEDCFLYQFYIQYSIAMNSIDWKENIQWMSPRNDGSEDSSCFFTHYNYSVIMQGGI